MKLLEGCQLGRVSYYNQDKGYGFIVPNGSEGELALDGQSVFFHYNRQRLYYCDGGDAVRWYNADKFDGSKFDLIPNVGDQVMFEMEPGRKPSMGPRCTHWAQMTNYQEVVKQIENRPIYRMVHRAGRVALSRLQERPKLEVVWEGKDIPRLRLAFPKNEWNTFDSEFAGRFFEVATTDGIGWELADDPR